MRKVRQVGRASDPQTEMQLQELTRVLNSMAYTVQEEIPRVIEDNKRNPFPKVKTPPKEPTGLKAFPGFLQFVLIWDPGDYGQIQGYYLEFSTSVDGETWSEENWERITLPNISTWIHSGLSGDLYYRYKLAAFNQKGESLFGEIVYAGKPGKASLSDDIVDEHDWMDVWNRAEAITEEGNFLAERIKGKLAEENMNFEPIEQEVFAIEEKLDSDDPDVWYSSIRQTAEAIVSEVAKLENALNSPDDTMWYSSIKQTADKIEQTVAKLNGDDAEQFSTIKQLADQIVSMVADLSEGGETYTKIEQTEEQLATVAAKARDNSEFISAIGQTAEEISSTVAEVFPDGTSERSTIQQLSDQISMIVMAVDENGDPVPVAQLKVGKVDDNGYILLNADDVIIKGSVTMDHLRSGEIDTDRFIIRSADGRTTFEGNTMTVRDENGVVRVRLGRLS